MKLVIVKDVDAFIETLEKPTRSKWLRQLTLLEEYGQHLAMPHVKHIVRGIRELRVRGSQEVRAFFIVKEEQAIIVHAYIKKAQKIAQKEIVTAQRRIDRLTQI